MNEEFEVDYNDNEESDQLGKVISQNILPNTIQNINVNDNVLVKTNISAKYFYIFYNNNNSETVKDFLYYRSLKIGKNDKIENFDKIMKEIDNCRNVYLMFVSTEKKSIKAIMKKDYLKYDSKDPTLYTHIKMVTKTKEEISCKELIQDYKFSDEDLSMIVISDILCDSMFDLGSGLMMKELNTEEEIEIFEKIRNAMMKKENFKSEKRKNSRSALNATNSSNGRRRFTSNNNNRSDSSSDSFSSSSSDKGDRKREKRVEKQKAQKEGNENPTQKNNPYLMNYYYPHQFYQHQQNRAVGPNEQMQFYPYPHFPMNPNLKQPDSNKSSNNNNSNNLNNVSNPVPNAFYPQMQMNPQMLLPQISTQLSQLSQIQQISQIAQMHFFNPGAFSHYPPNPNNPTPTQQTTNNNTFKKTKKRRKNKSSRSSSSRSSSYSSLSNKSNKSNKSNSRKKYFDLKHLDNYNELERTNSKNKETELKIKLNLNDINVIDLDQNQKVKKKQKKRDYSSSSNSSMGGQVSEFINNKRRRSISHSISQSIDKDRREVENNKFQYNKGSTKNNSKYGNSSFNNYNNNYSKYNNQRKRENREIRDIKDNRNYNENRDSRENRENREKKDKDNNRKYHQREVSEDRKEINNTYEIKKEICINKEKEIEKEKETLVEKGDALVRNNSKKTSNFSDIPPEEAKSKRKSNFSAKPKAENYVSKIQIPDEKFNFPENFVFSSRGKEDADPDKITTTNSTNKVNSTVNTISHHTSSFNSSSNSANNNTNYSANPNTTPTTTVINNQSIINTITINKEKSSVINIEKKVINLADLHSNSNQFYNTNGNNIINLPSTNENLKIINISGKKKIIINKERKNPDIKIIKRDKF